MSEQKSITIAGNKGTNKDNLQEKKKGTGKDLGTVKNINNYVEILIKLLNLLFSNRSIF